MEVLISGRTCLDFSGRQHGDEAIPTTGTGALLELLPLTFPMTVNEFGDRGHDADDRRLPSAQLSRPLSPRPPHIRSIFWPNCCRNIDAAIIARLRNRRDLPDVRMLHDFRRRLELTHCVGSMNIPQPLLAGTIALPNRVVVDSTDLPAATNAKIRPVTVAPGQYGWSQPQRGQSRYFIDKKHTLRVWLRQCDPAFCWRL
jgi:hypothetical protein